MKLRDFLNSVVGRLRSLMGWAPSQEDLAPWGYEERIAFRTAGLRDLLVEFDCKTTEEKLSWLVEHLRVYVRRWAGFVLMDQLTVEMTFNSDLFCLLRSAQEVINEEVSKARDISFPVAEWEAFENSLDFIQAHPSKENVSYVQQITERFYEAYQ